MSGPDTQLLHHNEPVFRDGEQVGYVTGGMWGHTVDAAVGMAIAIRAERGAGEVADRSWVESGEWAVELPGGLVPAEAQLRPWLR